MEQVRNNERFSEITGAIRVSEKRITTRNISGRDKPPTRNAKLTALKFSNPLATPTSAGSRVASATKIVENTNGSNALPPKI